MSASGVLEPIFEEILLLIRPLGDDWTVRQHVINEFRRVIESVESLRGATVEPFGSFVSNLFTRCGDLDISIELPNGSYISSAGKKLKQKLLGDLLIALMRNGGCRKLQLIPHARVPILKFESNHQNISCDISINNLKGLMKSKFLAWINGIDGRFRDLVLLVKEWAKAHDINNSKSGTLNSYSLSLLVIFHFQTCTPAIFPPLKEIYPGNIANDLSGVRDVVESRIEEICAANIARFKFNRHQAVNQSSLSELFVSFLKKFSDINSQVSDHVICTHTGQLEYIRCNHRWLSKGYAIFIEDPFEQPENTARAVGARQLIRISETFASTHHTLISGNQDQHALVGTLVRQQLLLQFVGRTPDRSPSISGGSHRGTRSQVNGAGTSISGGSHRGTRPQVNGAGTSISGGSHRGTRPQVHRAATSISRGSQLRTRPQVHKAATSISAGTQPGTRPQVHRAATSISAGTQPGTRPQVHRAATPQQLPTQFHNMSLGTRPDTLTVQRPVHQFQGQRQQVWRQRSNQ